MARSLEFSNGELYVGLDAHGQVTALTFPYVGLENHTAHQAHKIGVWVDGQVSWTSDSDWTHRSRYPAGAPIGHTVLVNEAIGILLELEDFVDSEQNIFIRNIHLVNIRDQQRSVKLFLHQAFTIGGTIGDDTVQYLPEAGSILHYKGRRAFVISGLTDVGQEMSEHSVGLFGDNLDGTWRDAEDGELAGSLVDNGQTDSTIGFSLIVGGLSSRRVHYWMTAATSVRAALTCSSSLKKSGLYRRLANTTDWWRKSLTPTHRASEQIESKYRKSYVDGLIRLRCRIDNRGAVMSGLDKSEAKFDPQAAAYAMWPLVRLGFRQEVTNYFNFVRQSLSDGGYLQLSYRPDGAMCGTKLPYTGKFAPLDSSQSAATLFVFSQLYALSKKPGLLTEYYKSLVKPLADFLVDYTDEQGLPLASYADHQKPSVSTYTVSLTHAALMAAVELAESSKDAKSSVKWRTAAEEMRLLAQELIISDDNLIMGTIEDQKPTITGLFGAFMFGLVDTSDPSVLKTVEYIEKQLGTSNGLYTFDNQQGRDYVGSLRMAQYYMEIGEAEKSCRIVDKVSTLVTETGGTLDTWVHAEYLNTLLDTLTRK